MQRRGEIEFSSEQKKLVRDTVAEELNEQEFDMFMYQCQRTGLDPLTKQIYAFKSKGKVNIQASIDGLRIVAERTGAYRGQTPAQWCGPDGEWVDVWTKSEYPTGARVGVYRDGFREPVYGIALWSDYAQTNRSGDPTYMWKNMPAHMLAKCAESLALRKAFPQDLSGIYSSEEMQQADQPSSGRNRGYAVSNDELGIGEPMDDPSIAPTAHAPTPDSYYKASAKAQEEIRKIDERLADTPDEDLNDLLETAAVHISKWQGAAHEAAAHVVDWHQKHRLNAS